jgi:signal transduction histidine kinase
MESIGRKVLLVEDNAAYASIYKRAIFEALGADMIHAKDGGEAIRFLLEEKIDLVLLDLGLPKVGGEDVLKQLRADPQFDNLPVIILTGDTNLDTQGRLLSQGADDFIEKGAPPDILMARIRTQLRHRLTLERLTEMALDMDIFTAGVLHDVRNIDASIQGYASLIINQVTEDPITNRAQILADLERIKTESHRISTYANHVIERVRATHREPIREPIAISDAIAGVRAMLSGAEMERGVSLTIEAVGTLLPVVGDPDFLRLALLNILQNAIKYGRGGVSPVVRVSQRNLDGPEKSPLLVTRFEDNGIGIPREQLREIFRPFVRGVQLKSHKTMGFGLGLALVNRAISKMGGKVWAEEKESGEPGTAICVALPKA